MKSRLTTVALVLILVIGLGIFLYPTVSDYWNSFHQSRAISSYVEDVANMDAARYEEMWNAAAAYNVKVAARNSLYLPEQEWEEYTSMLNFSGGIMGYVDIPSIDCRLPIYHGTDDSVLQIAVGHIEGSSLPVGGASTHCVLSGHRGLPSAKLFSDLDKLTVGEIFMLQVLDETLTYEVDQIRIVLPNEVGDLAIVSGQDYCTLVTCTPYGINSHRLLVRGHRIANQPGSRSIRVTADAMRIEPIMVAPIVAIPILLMLMLLMTVNGKRKPKKQLKKKQLPVDGKEEGGTRP